MRQKNVSKIVPFRSLKRYLPCRLFPVFSSNTVRFSPRYRSVSFRFVSFRSISFRLCAFTMELERTGDLASGGYTHFWKRLREASVRRQEAARAYQRGCEATGAPAKRLFSEE